MVKFLGVQMSVSSHPFLALKIAQELGAERGTGAAQPVSYRL